MLNCIDLLGLCLFISSAVDSVYVGQCFDTVYCAMLNFLVRFVAGFCWYQPFIDSSTFARDLEGGIVFVWPGVSTCF